MEKDEKGKRGKEIEKGGISLPLLLEIKKHSPELKLQAQNM